MTPDSGAYVQVGNVSDRANGCCHPRCPSHCCVLNGLWWGDPEFGPAADKLWSDFQAARHRWKAYESDVATTLGLLLETVHPPESLETQ